MRIALMLLLAVLVLAAIAGCPRKEPAATTDGTDINIRTDSDADAAAEAPSETTDTTTPPDTQVPPADTSATGEATPPTGDTATPPANTSAANDQGTDATADKPDMVVILETTKGNIEIGIFKTWAPIGGGRFLELVNKGFYTNAPFFRVLEGFVAQFGISADPALNAEWSTKTINDEPVVMGNLAGTVAFGKTGAPNSRSTHIFINLVDNSAGLDPQGFAAFGKVISGMDVAQKLYRVEADQAALSGPGGLAAFKAQYPEADFIKRAYVKQ